MEDYTDDESGSMTVRRMEKGHYDFVVRNYSLQKGIGVGEPIESEEFVAGGHRWTVCFYPNGKNVDACNSGNASLFIWLAADSATNVDCLYDMHILDQSGKGNNRGVSLIEGAPRWFRFTSLKGGHLTGFFRFMKRASFESPDYLKDDSLKISCTIGVLTWHIQHLPAIKPLKSNIRADFGNLLESKLGADVLFRVEDEIFLAHKFILAATSPVFRSHLAACDRLPEIVIPDMESRIFKAMLWYIYTGILREEMDEDFCDSNEFVLDSFMGKMLVVADRFELESLKRQCELCFVERISEESVAYLLYLADVCDATDLKVACLRFAVENQDAVLQSNGCEYLKRNCPSLFLKLIGYEENLSSSEGGELDLCGKIILVAKGSLSSVFGPWIARHTNCKLKDA